MIVVHLAGGLGNQMFQYAAGLSLARRNQTELWLDTSAFSGGAPASETTRALGITDFNISAKVLPADEVQRHRNPLGPISKAKRLISRKIFRRYYVDWHPEVMNLRSDAYLEGYFQDQRYFLSIKDQIRSEFKLTASLEEEVASIQAAISELPGPTVSVHVRRGDYAANPQTAASYNVCSPAYYSRAINYIKKRNPTVQIVLFSDDVEWVLENIPETKSAFIVSGRSSQSKTPLAPSQELSLMARCDHSIIANSTFSWWGAYLRQIGSGAIVAPDPWSKDAKLHRDIVPKDWIRLRTQG